MTPEEQAAADAAAAAAAAKELGWRAGLPEDLRSDPSLESFKDETEMIQMPINVAKSFVHTKKLVGADVIKMPKTDEEYQEIYNKLGRPESKDHYVLPIPPDINPALKETIGKDAEWFKEEAHKLGLSDKQASNLFVKFANRVSEQYTGQTKVVQDEIINTEIQLRTEFGTTYDAKNIIGDRAIEKLGGEELAGVFKQIGIDKYAGFQRFKFKLGEMMAEDMGIDKSTGQLLISKEGLQEQIQTALKDPAYLNANDPNHKTVVQKVAQLMQQRHGTVAIPVTDSMSR